MQSSRNDLRTPLLEDSAGTGVSRRARRIRSGLVVAEVILATVLLVGAGLLTRSFVSLIGVPTGFEARGLLTFHVRVPSWRYETPEQVLAFFEQLQPRMAALPGVEEVALVSDLPFTTENRFQSVNPVGTVGPGYWRAMGIDLIAGREFRPEDRGEGELVVVVNRTMAERFWSNQDAVGKRFIMGSGEDAAPAVVIGVASDVLDDGFDGEHEPRFYLAFLQRPQRGTAVVVRGGATSSSLAPVIRREVRVLDDEALVSNFRPMDDVVAATVTDERMAVTLAGGFSLFALVLAAVGIYGVMSYAVGERRREIGIRGALGAQRSDVMKLVLGHSGLLALAGTAGGVALALGLARLLSTFLYGVEPTDFLTLAVTPLVLASVAFAASYLPAARATKISPVEALRSER
jgi:predicted permease